MSKETKDSTVVLADSVENKSIQDVNSEDLKGDEILDHAAIFVNTQRELYPDITPAEESKAIRRTDWCLVPILFVTATFSAVDKVSLGTAAIYGLREDCNLSTDQYTWVSSILFIGSLVGVFPTSYLALRYPAGKVFVICSLLWSMMTLLLPVCNSYAPLMVLRFFMGLFEAANVPICTLMITRFYLKKEQPVRLAWVFAFASSVINGFLSWVVGYFNDSIPKWKYLFILIGCVSFTWSLLMLYFLPDSPMNARFLTDKQKYIITKRVLENSTGVQTNKFKPYQAKEGALDIKAYIIFLFNIGINIPNGGLTSFTAIIINTGLHFSPQKSSLMSIPTGVIATIAAVFFNYLCGKYSTRRCMITIISLFVPLIGAIISYTVADNNIGARLVGLYLMYFYFAPYVIMASLAQANTAGNTKKSVVYGINYLGYAVGALTGNKSFDSGFTGGFIAMLCAYCACMLLAGIYWVICLFENKAKMKIIESDKELHLQFEAMKDAAPESQNLLDLTDKEKKTFLYTT